MLGWHFVADTLRNGDPIPPDGEPLRYDGPLVICQSGLHASVRIIDALQYAPGSAICRVECSDVEWSMKDKLVCGCRTILWRVDGEQLLRDFARRCAEDVMDFWNPPDVAREYLATGDTSLRLAAWSAAWSAARSAQELAQELAARSAAWSAWESAAESVAGSAARSAAESVAGSAARSAAESVARSAADSASAAKSVARSAARDAMWLEARDAMLLAARDAQNERLEAMVTNRRQLNKSATEKLGDSHTQ